MWKLLLIAGACTDKPERTDSGTEPTPSTVIIPTREAELTAGGEVSCAEPNRQLEQHYDGPFELRAEADKPIRFWGGGVIAGDFDQDGFIDLVLPGRWETQYFRGLEGGQFVEVMDALPAAELDLGSGGAPADYDGDGDLDILVTRYEGTNRLLQNDGLGHFTDVTGAAGLTTTDARMSMASSWGDYDRDGDLDLYIGAYGFIDESGSNPNHDDFLPADPDFLYRNEGDGTFTDISSDLPAEVHDGYAFSGGWFDLDRDGWLDLYVVHDFGRSFPNRLLWNRQGTLELDRGASGLDVQITGMGLGVGDIDGDGIDDFIMSAWNGNSAMLSLPLPGGGAAWVESVESVGLQNDLSRHQKIGWGLDLVDMDNDGDLDVPFVYGWLDANYPAAPKQPDALYLNQGDGTFIDVGKELYLHHPTKGRGFVAEDLNRDGWLDLVKRDLGGPTLVHLSRCGSEAWLQVSLRQPGLNPFAVGARVVVRGDGTRQSRVVRAGGTNHASAGPPAVHFGLGALSEIDAIEVIWPDGEASRVENVGTRQFVEIVRTEL